MKTKVTKFIFICVIVILTIGCNSNDVNAAKEYKITYKLNGGISNSKNKSMYTKKMKVKLYAPKREGYTFVGWYKNSKLTKRVKKIKAGSKGKLTLYAKWTAKKYSVKYSLYYGTNNDKNPTSYSCVDSIKLENPTKKGYVFKGWFLDKEYTKPVSKVGDGMIGSVRLYAKWNLESLNINQIGTGNMIWSWWYYPQVISFEEAPDNYIDFETEAKMWLSE